VTLILKRNLTPPFQALVLCFWRSIIPDGLQRNRRQHDGRDADEGYSKDVQQPGRTMLPQLRQRFFQYLSQLKRNAVHVQMCGQVHQVHQQVLQDFHRTLIIGAAKGTTRSNTNISRKRREWFALMNSAAQAKRDHTKLNRTTVNTKTLFYVT